MLERRRAKPVIRLRAVSERIESWEDSRIGFDLLEDGRRAKEEARMALSDDLRERVVGRWWKVACRATRGSETFWGQHRHRRALGCALQSQGRDLAGSYGGRSSFRSYRGPSRLSARCHSPPAGLVPTLSKGDIVVMDNLSSHKGLGVEQLIKAAEPNCDICRLIAPT
jgi:hypothetical protein